MEETHVDDLHLAALADESRHEPAVRCIYNEESDEWNISETAVVIEEDAFEEGGMRVCHRIADVKLPSKCLVGKIFYVDVPDEAYFHEAITQLKARMFSEKFNQLRVCPRINFSPVSIYMLKERDMQLVNVEPRLSGKYVKYQDNFGGVGGEDPVPQAFSHFTWEESRHTMIIVDLQGVGNTYTDPQIHSIDGKGFGAGNSGLKGVRQFFSTHRCNAICKKLCLPQPSISKELESEVNMRKVNKLHNNYGADVKIALETMRSVCRESISTVANKREK